VEVFAGYNRQRMDNGAVFAAAECKFDITHNGGAAQGGAGDIFSRDLPDTSRSNRDAEPGTHEAQNCQPLRSFLHDARSEAMPFAQRDRFLIRQGTGGWREEDKGVVAKICRRNHCSSRKPMRLGKDGNKRLGKQRFDGETFDRSAVAQKSGVECSTIQ